MKRTTSLSLQHSESVVTTAAAQIYAARIVANHVKEGEEEQWIERAVEDAIRIAHEADARVRSDNELQS